MIRLLKYLLLICTCFCAAALAAEPVLYQEAVWHPLAGDYEPSLEVTPPANASLLIRIEGDGVDFHSIVEDSQGATVSHVYIPYNRLGPRFHLLPAASAAGSYRLRGEILSAPKQSRISIGIFVLADQTDTQRRLINAYRNTAQALQYSKSKNNRYWNRQIAALRATAAEFSQLDKAQLSLWTRYYADHLFYAYVWDLPNALQSARELLQLSSASENQKLILASHQLLGGILAERFGEQHPGDSARQLEAALMHLQQAEVLATELKLPFEQAWAINNRGIANYYRHHYPEALQAYEASLRLSDAIGEQTLALLSQANRALVSERLGRMEQALAVLTDTMNRHTRAGNGLAVAHNQDELGRISGYLGHYREALKHQSEAIRLYEEYEDRQGLALAHLNLGRTYRSLNDAEQAESHYRYALNYLDQSGENSRVASIYSELAALARGADNQQAASEYRQRQADNTSLHPEQQQLRLDWGKDALHFTGGDAANLHFAQCRDHSDKTETSVVEGLCLLWYWSTLPGDQPLPVAAKVDRAFNQVLEASAISQEFEARLLRSRIAARQGQLALALQHSSQLVFKLRTYRQHLPGILGAHYWNGNSEALNHHMELLIQTSQGQHNQAVISLAALENLRNVSRTSHSSAPAPAETGDSSLRGLLSAREQAHSRDDRRDINLSIDQWMLQNTAADMSPQFTVENLNEQFSTLGEDAVVLTWLLTPRQAWLWRISHRGVDRFELQQAPVILNLIKDLKTSLQVIGRERQVIKLLDELGDRLLAPVQDQLPEIVLAVPAGPLTGLPLDALRLNQRYLIQDHLMANLSSLRRLSAASGSMRKPLRVEQALLMGNPQLWGTDLAELPGTALELEIAARSLAPATILRLEQAELTLRNFMRLELASYDLIHIATHGEIDSRNPELSKISLSAATPDSAAEFLLPGDFSRVRLNQPLLVLSACNVSVNDQLNWDNSMGFFEVMFSAGAWAALATVQIVSDRDALAFIPALYRPDQRAGSVLEQLALIKRSAIKASTGDSWWKFQLFI